MPNLSIIGADMRVPLVDPTPSFVRRTCESYDVQSHYLAVLCGGGRRFVKLDPEDFKRMVSECSDICLEWECEILLLPDNPTLYIVPKGA